MVCRCRRRHSRAVALLAEFSEDASRRLGRDVDAAVERLAAFPNSGRVVPEWEGLGLREVILGRYRLIYRLSSEELEIVAFTPGVLPLG